MKVLGILLLILIWSGFYAPRCRAAVYYSNGSVANVQQIHDTLAVDGDTIMLPAGTFTWNTHVRFTKAVNVQGAGISRTIINDNVPKTGGEQSVLWSFDVAAGRSIRVTGFTIHGIAQDT